VIDLDNFENNEQNKMTERDLRDNFKHVKANDSGEKQMQKNRDLRDNFKNIQEFMNDQKYE
jgi:hypothetical protein